MSNFNKCLKADGDKYDVGGKYITNAKMNPIEGDNDLVTGGHMKSRYLLGLTTDHKNGFYTAGDRHIKNVKDPELLQDVSTKNYIINVIKRLAAAQFDYLSNKKTGDNKVNKDNYIKWDSIF